MYKQILLLLLLTVFAGCSNEPELEVRPEVNWTKDNSTDLSKIIAAEEEVDITAYLEMRKSWKMTKTGTGLRYYIYEEGNGKTPQPGDIAEVEYIISLLDGTECYRTESDEYEELRVDRSDVESGIQEAIKKMKVGDRAKLIVPSHLGHGLLGDMKKIPPMNTLVIDIHLLGIKLG